MKMMEVQESRKAYIMKIIVSPSKTQSKLVIKTDLDSPRFYSVSKKIIREIKSYKKDELAQIMRLDGKLLDETYLNYKNIKVNQKELTPAIQLYTGVVYDSLSLDQYDVYEMDYLNRNVRILSALYGVLRPMDGVQPYRLDFTMKLKGLNLNALWKENLLSYFKEEELILDCASHEFSHFLNPLKEKVHRIEFIDVVNGQEKIISYNAKKLRGMMVDYCIKNNVNSVEEIRDFTQEAYTYQSNKSDLSKSVFIRYQNSIQE